MNQLPDGGDEVKRSSDYLEKAETSGGVILPPGISSSPVAHAWFPNKQVAPVLLKCHLFT